MYDLEPERVKDFLAEKDVDRAAIQLPSGLRTRLKRIKEPFEEEGVEVMGFSDSCYGACDLADERAVTIGCDGLVHYGHSDMGLPTSLPTLYVEARMDTDFSIRMEDVLPELEGSTWGLTTTVQHIGSLEEFSEILGEEGIDTVIGGPGPRSKYPGQILGCDWGSAESISGEVDGFIYLGTGEFHSRGVALATGRPVVSINPVSGDFRRLELEESDFLKKRYAMITKAKSGDSFGVIVSTKKGQERLGLARDISEKLSGAGYDSYVLVFDEVEPGVLGDYRLDAFVSTACPRISLDDSELYKSPVLTPFEAMVLTGDEDWGNYRIDDIGVNF